jgi:3D (Asp-Asp-Asp) domain-containing protein
MAMLLGGIASPIASSVSPPPPREDLGIVHVTRYTHHEGGRLTASGYVLKDADEDRVCAVSRDWWKHRIMPGDLVFVAGFRQPCVVLDTMAVANRNGKVQLHWVDLYLTSVERGLEFGIQRRHAWLQRRTE